jgi:hypothetical protein
MASLRLILKLLFFALVVVLAVELAGGGMVRAQQTITFRDGLNDYAGTDDATLYMDRPDDSNGGHPFVYVGVTQVNSPRRALLRFDLTSLPAEAIVQSIELELTVDRARPVPTTITLHRLLNDWGEGTTDSGEPGGLGTDAQPGDATWASNFHGTSAWGTAGGDLATTPSAVQTSGSSDDEIVFSDPAMAEDVRGWLAEPSANFGWIVLGDENDVFTARRFVSSEGSPGSRPTLRIVLLENASDSSWLLYE